MNNKNDDMYYLMNVIGIITACLLFSPILMIVGAIMLMVAINPITWMGSFFIWFHKRINSQ